MLLSDNILADVYKSRAVIVFISHEQLFIAQKKFKWYRKFRNNCDAFLPRFSVRLRLSFMPSSFA